ncbi:hypothetical protein IWW56_002343 [Coemansia sp. RSA 2131]|nr:hypothetical protein IWW56_002343 [Coemansia sp. RSA 2131]
MGCRKCRGWEDSSCCLSQSGPCDCACHAACDCAFCHTVELKARSLPSAYCGNNVQSRSTTSRITLALRSEPRSSISFDDIADIKLPQLARLSSDEQKVEKIRRWPLKNSTIKPLRMFA